MRSIRAGHNVWLNLMDYAETNPNLKGSEACWRLNTPRKVGRAEPQYDDSSGERVHDLTNVMWVDGFAKIGITRKSEKNANRRFRFKPDPCCYLMECFATTMEQLTTEIESQRKWTSITKPCERLRLPIPRFSIGSGFFPLSQFGVHGRLPMA